MGREATGRISGPRERTGSHLVGLLALAAAAALGNSDALADGLTLGPLVQVSEVSPFGVIGDCGDFPFDGENIVDSEVEPWIDVNPADTWNIVAFWQQDRWSNGGARSNVAGVSFDGGETWETVVVPGLTDCSGGTFERASDPWLAFARDGTLHQISLVVDFPVFGGRNGMAVSKSEDGGLSWSDPILLIEDDGLQVLNDKQSITADPVDSRFVYATWDRLEAIDGMEFRGPMYFARTTDGGVTWEPARSILDLGDNNQSLASQIVALKWGRRSILFDVFNRIININPEPGSETMLNLAYIYSLDRGQTWRPRRNKTVEISDIITVGTVTPDDEIPIRDASFLFDVAADPKRGLLYAVWQDSRFSSSGGDDIVFSMSWGGLRWTKPVKINRTPINLDNPLRQQALIPSVAVTGDGVVGVTYYDFRNDDDSGELADHFLIRCKWRCWDPAQWAHEVRLTDESFDYTLAPDAGGLFLGDYVGLAADKRDFLTFFSQAVDDTDPASGFFRRVSRDGYSVVSW